MCQLKPVGFIVTVLVAPFFLLQNMNRVVYLLLCLETLSMLTLFMVFANASYWTLWGLGGTMLVLVCLVLEASMGLSLLVTLIRWQNKFKIMSE